MPDGLPATIAHRYSREVALRHELLYGRGYQGPAEPEVFDALAARAALRAGADVLDVGSGLGGDAFRLATRFGVRVVGLDASPDMTDLARERQEVDAPGADVELVCGNVLTSDVVRPGAFDVVWTRDAGAFLTHDEKPVAWRRLHDALRPGGSVLVTDYCLGTSAASAEFGERMLAWGQHMLTLDAYADLLTSCGFADVVTEDRTADLVASQEHGLRVLEERGDDVRALLSPEEHADLTRRWRTKLTHSTSGELVWMVLTARR
ncbi:methyltransferase domain-containing protein [Cellulomonas sp. H30R-01]|jgi:phosphoethanolamine N-methyltransferase|uniref:methyltransferase domain-containing protein n=1 Tax=Cellulomonas sp. H30R-01 TaxID=2704467 RepID=UPI00138BD919|nr:methyltransferase domain-containing protein [Cellulomonas sp. H30R-01]QHT57082.1 methyltransferase domain-containing protein [Cellulomonas sp. H30R-01]